MGLQTFIDLKILPPTPGSKAREALATYADEAVAAEVIAALHGQEVASAFGNSEVMVLDVRLEGESGPVELGAQNPLEVSICSAGANCGGKAGMLIYVDVHNSSSAYCESCWRQFEKNDFE